MTQGRSPLTLEAGDRDMLERIAATGDAMIARAIAWANINSGSRNLAGLTAQAAQLEPAMQEFDGTFERIPLADTLVIDADGREVTQTNGDALRLTMRPKAPVQIVLTGHYDTVYPADTDFRSVVTLADGTLHGPGIADMKGGISLMLAALAAFEDHALFANIGYRVLLSPDEETGSLASAPLLAALGATAHVGMTYEPALADGKLAAARKGSGNYHIVVQGKAAHAGRNFNEGRNALMGAVRLAERLDALNGQHDDVTVNIARIDGGGALNAVPERAVLRFNIRVPDASAQAWLNSRLDTVLAQSLGTDLSVALYGGVTRPPKPFNAAQQTLFAAVAATGALIGQDISWTSSGG
ncbi:MAG: hydrolase, partial [Sphingobium sp.]